MTATAVGRAWRLLDSSKVVGYAPFIHGNIRLWKYYNGLFPGIHTVVHLHST